MTAKRMLALLLTALLALSAALPACAMVTSSCPLIDPQTVEYVETADDIMNVLLLGVEQGFPGFNQSDWTNKPTIRECHTDVLMVVAINKTKRRIDLVSLPRDTLVYVPGVYGIYKLNAAFNLADSNEAGFEKVKETVSWLLGGVKIDAYCAVDMKGLVTLGDAMGGLDDFYMDMKYTGSSGIRYGFGNQHLDGWGIMDYARARSNATLDNSDLGRNRRCRRLVEAMIQKLRYDEDLVKELWNVSQQGDFFFSTDLTFTDLITLFDAVWYYDDSIGSYGFTGYYADGGLEWYFNYTNQSERRTLLQYVYGIYADNLPYVSRDYTIWLRMQGGLLTVHNIRQAKQIIEFAKAAENPTPVQLDSLEQLEAAYDSTVTAFDRAAFTLDDSDRYRMKYCRQQMEAQADIVAAQFNYGRVSWERGDQWDQDPLINEYPELNWR